jgi:hypothetical protein
MLWVFDAHAPLFRSGWFVESLATQSLVVFVIRTRRVPFFHSRPSAPLLATTLAVVTAGIAIPYSPVAHALGFRSLPSLFLAILGAMTATYLALAEGGKSYFYRRSGARDRSRISESTEAVTAAALDPGECEGTESSGGRSSGGKQSEEPTQAFPAEVDERDAG